MHPIIASMLGTLATSAPVYREAMRTRPAKVSAGANKQALMDALDKRMKKVAVSEPDDFIMTEITPQDVQAKWTEIRNSGDPMMARAPEKLHPFFAPQIAKKMSGHNIQHFALDSAGKPDFTNKIAEEVAYNPYASAEVLAHEMGHTVTANTDIGSKIRDFRTQLDNNPALRNSVLAATTLLPAGVAMATPGDDEYGQTLAGIAALNAPALIDEGLATKNGLALMQDAGIRASLGQRGRLAGGLLSYLVGPAIFGMTGTAIGNQFDEDIPVQ